MTLRRVECRLFWLRLRSRYDSVKTSGPTATRGSSYTARPLSLPRFLYSFRERQAGVESLVGWIRRECLEALQAATSWADLHQALQDNGLALLRRGNGLVIAHPEGLMVKASAVSRELSAAQLEARLGPFRTSAMGGWSGPQQGRQGPARPYEPRLLRSQSDTTGLFARYQAERQQVATHRAAELAKARDRRNRQIAAAKRVGKAKRAAIGLVGKGLGKQLLYRLASQSLGGECQRIQAQYRRERQAINARWQRPAWVDWLRRQAGAGDAEACAALRATSPGRKPAASAVGGLGTGHPTALAGDWEGITRVWPLLRHGLPTGTTRRLTGQRYR